MRWILTTIGFAVFLIACTQKQADPLIQKHLQLWQKKGFDQVPAIKEIFTDLEKHQDTTLFLAEIDALYKYLAIHPDPLIEANTLLYHVVGARLLNLGHQPGLELLERAVVISEKMGNEVLASELYSTYSALFDNQATYLFYSFKSLEIQERLGAEYFEGLQRKYFIVSSILYHAKEYMSSIEYANKSLRNIEQQKNFTDTTIYIHLYDIIGNNYLRLNKIDSAEKYFQLGWEACHKYQLKESFKKIWSGIYTGNLGRIEYLKGNIEASIPKIEEHLAIAEEFKDSLNIAIAGIRLGDIYYKLNQLNIAEKYYLQAMEAGGAVKAHYQSTYAADLLTKIFILKKDYKKALEYELISDKYDSVHNEYLELVNLQQLDALRNMERTQVALEKSKVELAVERNKRMNLIYFFCFTTIIIVALILRIKFRSKHHLLLTQKQNEALEMEMNFASIQIENFKKNIIEKNQMIEKLTQKLTYNNVIDLHQSLAENTLITDEEWKKFKLEFLKIYPSVPTVVSEYLNQPTPAEQRLITLLILGLDHQQIGNALGISKESVARSKRRLRARLQESSNIEIEDLIAKILAQ